MTDNITLPRSVVEQALEALFMYKPMVTGVTFQHGLDAMQALRAALDQPVAQQPLTEEQIKTAFLNVDLFEEGDELLGYEVDITRAIEAMHGIGGEA